MDHDYLHEKITESKKKIEDLIGFMHLKLLMDLKYQHRKGLVYLYTEDDLIILDVYKWTRFDNWCVTTVLSLIDQLNKSPRLKKVDNIWSLN
jgi:hypothetical protein